MRIHTVRQHTVYHGERHILSECQVNSRASRCDAHTLSVSQTVRWFDVRFNDDSERDKFQRRMVKARYPVRLSGQCTVILSYSFRRLMVGAKHTVLLSGEYDCAIVAGKGTVRLSDNFAAPCSEEQRLLSDMYKLSITESRGSA